MGFLQKAEKSVQRSNSRVCVGLDPDIKKIPNFILKESGSEINSIRIFLWNIVDAVAPYTACFKPNMAFYEVWGSKGWELLADLIKKIPDHIPVILDGKRGDIGNTARAYAKSLFTDLGGDAVTVNPYMGWDSVAPFLEFKDKGVFILCLTSNPGAADFQLQKTDSGIPLFLEVARKVKEWGKANSNIGIVAGATRPEQLTEIRNINPACPLLIPGIGAQGGNVKDTVLAAAGESNIAPFYINASRSILYASGEKDYGQAAAKACKKFGSGNSKIPRFIPAQESLI